MRIAVLASTAGTTLEGLIGARRAGKLEAQLECVIADRECGALKKALAAGIDAVLVDRSKFASRDGFEDELDAELRLRGVELVCLMGFMRVLSPLFVKRWRGKVLNVHPSLLPKHAGGMDLKVHEAVLAAGEKESGCTIHFVDESVDGGRIVAQETVPVVVGDTPESLKERVQEAEKKLYLKVINEFAGKEAGNE